MTNNDHLKEDATVLLTKLMAFNRKYSLFDNKTSNSALLEKDLRLILKIVRTDEENSQQTKQDCYC
jgi:hypothetical protein